MQDSNDQTIEVWGDFACFSRPESKVERLTYPVPTPSATRGIFSAIYSKPVEFYWQVKRIEILKPLMYVNFRRNEVKCRMGKLPFLVEEERTQRQTTALKDVRYRITAEMVPRSAFENGDHEKAMKRLKPQFEKRVKRGQCFFQPSFGLREFPAYFSWGSSGQPPLADLNLDLGYMLYDVFNLHDYEVSKKCKPSVSLFHAQVQGGVLNVPPYDDARVLKPKEGVKCAD
ncbi:MULTISPECIES: type I-C CRISPR-associated protein Cas5c [Caproicibacterium]|uniref:pre-crRNA processing endonuclease n=1 Tax=Caproicibacterium argilliputei TaxID=3030016 RepID=A0AA97D955_9FIRM|nr:type I-C CRISPR-associated protein Cas5c [Caproicibacterium argilliputei]WOC31313.1 type I-C CRISPR-associated protein Cas5c [Caproicibacterium argilliputei]